MWTICLKDNEIVKAGLNVVIDGTFDSFLLTSELYALQAEKLEYSEGSLKVKEGEKLLTLEELNAQREVPPVEVIPQLVIPENM